jgi:hypothetical protein
MRFSAILSSLLFFAVTSSSWAKQALAPEIGAEGSVAAIGAVAALTALLVERRRRRRS